MTYDTKLVQAALKTVIDAQQHDLAHKLEIAQHIVLAERLYQLELTLEGLRDLLDKQS